MLLKHGCSRSRKQNVSLSGEFLTVHREGGGSATLLVRDVGGSVSTTELSASWPLSGTGLSKTGRCPGQL